MSRPGRTDIVEREARFNIGVVSGAVVDVPLKIIDVAHFKLSCLGSIVLLVRLVSHHGVWSYRLLVKATLGYIHLVTERNIAVG